jgi:hypothetical protein
VPLERPGGSTRCEKRLPGAPRRGPAPPAPSRAAAARTRWATADTIRRRDPRLFEHRARVIGRLFNPPLSLRVHRTRDVGATPSSCEVPSRRAAFFTNG